MTSWEVSTRTRTWLPPCKLRGRWPGAKLAASPRRQPRWQAHGALRARAPRGRPPQKIFQLRDPDRPPPPSPPVPAAGAWQAIRAIRPDELAPCNIALIELRVSEVSSAGPLQVNRHLRVRPSQSEARSEGTFNHDGDSSRSYQRTTTKGTAVHTQHRLNKSINRDFFVRAVSSRFPPEGDFAV